MGRRGLPAGRHDRGAVVRSSRRSLRAQADAADRIGRFHRRVGGLRSGAHAADARHRARRAGPRRRWPDDARAGVDRRERSAARSRTLPGLFCRRIRAGIHIGPDPGRLSHRARELALGVRDQSSARRARGLPCAKDSGRRTAAPRNVSARCRRHDALLPRDVRIARDAVIRRTRAGVRLMGAVRADRPRRGGLCGAVSLGTAQRTSRDSGAPAAKTRHMATRCGRDLLCGDTLRKRALSAALPSDRTRVRHRHLGNAASSDYPFDGHGRDTHRTPRVADRQGHDLSDRRTIARHRVADCARRHDHLRADASGCSA